MAEELRREYGSQLVNFLTFRGILAVLFGLVAVIWPDITLGTLIYLFAAFILISGLVMLISGFVDLFASDKSVINKVLEILIGVLEIGVGVFLLRNTAIGAATVALIIGFTILIRGVLDVIAGLFEDEGAMTKVLTVLIGVLGFIAGIFILRYPISGAVAFVWVLGLYALLSGAMLIVLAISTHNELKALK